MKKVMQFRHPALSVAALGVVLVGVCVIVGAARSETVLTQPASELTRYSSPGGSAKPAGIIDAVNTTANVLDFFSKFHPYLTLAEWDDKEQRVYSGAGVAITLPYHLQGSAEAQMGHKTTGRLRGAIKFIFW